MQPLVLSPQHSHHQQPHRPHQVPFGHIQTQPGSLSHGFGLSPASSFSLASTWASSSSTPTPSTPSSSSTPAWRASPAWGSTSAAAGGVKSSPVASPLPASRRRRRSASVESEDDGGRDSMRMDGSSVETPIAKMRGMKKARVAGGAGSGAGAAQDDKELSHTPPVGSTDLGKALGDARRPKTRSDLLFSSPPASLSKESLLTLLTTLLTTQPALRPAIAALLPPPTLANTLASLQTLERAVIASLPSGQVLREDYIWGRVRVSLEEYISESKSFLSAFCQPTSSHAVLPTQPSEDEIGHPSTTFAFLYALTSSLRRLEFALPSSSARNPLSSHLLPLTINAWHHFLTRLSTAVNSSGRVLSAGLLKGWFVRMDELCVDSPLVEGKVEGGAKRACEGVRERMRKELGWLVGIKPVIAGAVMMDEEEEL
ncbi:hypothetical protein P7C70_g3188, partial [Phenoliferia sp. Uapishka_3]